MRNGAPTFAQLFQPSGGLYLPSVEVYLDCAGSSPFWAIQVADRVVYRMPPNPLDASYTSGPSFDGAWNVAEAKPGARLLFIFRTPTCHVVVQARYRLRLTWLQFTKR